MQQFEDPSSIPPSMKHLSLLISLALLLPACASIHRSGPAPTWTIAIHGGAGVPELSAEKEAAYRRSLSTALELGKRMLTEGASALDTVEQVVRVMEDDALFNSGKGAVYTAETKHELDASIMDGATLNCGAITGVKTVKNPISLARLVMEQSPHVFFSGDGAERFADGVEVERVPNSYFDTPFRLQQLKDKLNNGSNGTVGCVVMDSHGNLAAATSTGGMTAKQFGRIGDSPIIGAGTYANNESCAVSGTGFGEQFIRHTVARDIAAQMEYGGKSLGEAADHVIHSVLDAGDGGVVAVSRDGDIAMVFNSVGMFRACADANGRSEISILK